MFLHTLRTTLVEQRLLGFNQGPRWLAVDLVGIATASILIRVKIEHSLASVIALRRNVVCMGRFFLGGVTAEVLLR